MSTEVVAPVRGAAPRLPARTWGEELRAGLSLAWPLIVAQLAQNLLFTTDVVLMGRLGPDYLAAGTLATAYMIPLQLLGAGIVGAVAPLVAQARGRRDIKAVRRVVRQGFWVTILVASLLMPVVLSMRSLYAALGQDAALLDLSQTYIEAGAWMLYPAMATMVVRAFLSSFEATRVILVVTVIGVMFNIVAAWALIFGELGMPRMELRGAALSTGITHMVMFLALLFYVLQHRKLKRFNILVRFWKPDWSRFRQIFRIGLPIGLTIAAEVGIFSAAAFLMGWLGTEEVAAHAVALQLTATSFMVPLGMGMAATVRVGIAYGRGDAGGVHRAGWTNILLGTGFMVVTCTLFLTLPGPLVAIFIDTSKPENAAVLSLATGYLVIAGLFQIFDGAQGVANHALRGLSDTRIPMLIAIVGYWVIGLPVAWVLGFEFGLGGTGVWIGLATGLGLNAIMLVSRFALRERLGLMKDMVPQPH
ncbi:MATE family efflux transporter [Devosia sp.]|uniref:MATE family efflux transporter n=1 Tax=Devosia sp. TaxID=1871048 RepID=UPI003A942F8E